MELGGLEGASDVTLAPDGARECEDRPRGRAHAHRLGLILTYERGRVDIHTASKSKSRAALWLESGRCCAATESERTSEQAHL